jgi:hypothetical protein
MKIVKVNNLPQTYEADTIYIVRSSTSGLVEIYVTDNTGSEIRTLPDDSGVISSLLPRSEVGMTVASLVDGKIPTDQLPPAILGALTYQGTWNASTNNPAIPTASPSNKGWYYVVNTAGTSSIGGVTDWEIGDWVVSSGTSWGKIDNSDKVSSVAGKTGVVTLTKSDVGLGNVDDTSDASKSVLSATKLTTARTINGIAFDGSANISVPVDWSAVTGKPAVIAAGADAATARSAIGAASLVGGKIPEHELPSLAITDVFPVASEAAMLALTAEKGDMAIRSDLNKCFALSAAPASTLANWLELKTPANAVLSVAGRTGAITLSSSDVGLANVNNTSDANKPISTATQNALNGKAPLADPTFTGLPKAPTAAVGTNTTQLATTAHVFAERAATATLTNKTLTTPVLTGAREVRVAMPANAIDLSAGNVFTKTISGATSLTVSNTPTTGNAASFILELTNAGSAAITWFSGVKWAGGTAPTLTTSGVDVIGFYTHDGGTTWRGFFLSKDSK